VAGFCEYGDEPLGFGATELVILKYPLLVCSVPILRDTETVYFILIQIHMQNCGYSISYSIQ
jgi:hypothetical protein